MLQLVKDDDYIYVYVDGKLVAQVTIAQWSKIIVTPVIISNKVA